MCPENNTSFETFETGVMVVGFKCQERKMLGEDNNNIDGKV